VSGRRLAAATLAAFASIGAIARADTFVYEHRFTTDVPGNGTGMAAHIVYPDYAGKPKSADRVVVELPAGSRFDESAVPVCRATDADLYSRGLSACPAQSRVGGGDGSVVTGFGPPFDPLRGDLHVFHGPGELMNVGTLPGSDRVAVIDRGRIDGRRVVQDPAPAPGGPPDGRTSGKEVRLRIDARSAAGRSFLTTPADCPSAGSWTFRITAHYEDGTSDSATSTSPCRIPSAAERRPASMGLRVRPGLVRAGDRVRVRFQVTSPSAACRGGALVRFAGRRVRTDGRGRATMARRLLRPGRYVARAVKPGCRPAAALVYVRP
jgi:hypothetical protein